MQLKKNTLLMSFLLITTLFNTMLVDNGLDAAPTKRSVLTKAFADNKTFATKKTLWLNKSLQGDIKTILDHNYPKLRLRYWLLKTTTAHKEHDQTLWFLDEIGKNKPISFAVSVIDNKVQFVQVLKFRESRGGEIKMSRFRNQFVNIALTPYQELDLQIDGISGATMSVTAIKKVTRLGLFLHQHVIHKLDNQ